MVRYSDEIYNALCVSIALTLCHCLVKSLCLIRARQDERGRRLARGLPSAAAGTLIALASGLVADALLKRSDLFQRVRFGGYYLGFALITAGMIAVANAGQPERPAGTRRWVGWFNVVLWAAFLAPLAIAAVYLLDPHTFITNVYGVQVQRTIYWAPMLATTRHVTAQQVKDAMLAAGQATLDQAVQSGRLTQAQADQASDDLVQPFAQKVFNMIETVLQVTPAA